MELGTLFQYLSWTHFIKKIVKKEKQTEKTQKLKRLKIQRQNKNYDTKQREKFTFHYEPRSFGTRYETTTCCIQISTVCFLNMNLELFELLK